MKKTIVGLLLLTGTLSLRAEDSYIYWLQDTATLDGAAFGNTDYSAKIVAISGTGAEWVYGSGTYLNLYNAGGTGGTPGTSIEQTTLVNLSSYNDNVPRYGNITSLGTGSYTYFIELFNENGIFARSEGVSDISAYVYTTGTGMAIPAQGFSAPVFTAASVPEPTSGLMLLIGSALLALRRKRA